MTTKHTGQSLENIIFATIEKGQKVTIDDFGTWLLHRAYRPEEYGQDKADNCIAAWDLYRQFKQENGL